MKKKILIGLILISLAVICSAGETTTLKQKIQAHYETTNTTITNEEAQEMIETSVIHVNDIVDAINYWEANKFPLHGVVDAITKWEAS